MQIVAFCFNVDFTQCPNILGIGLYVGGKQFAFSEIELVCHHLILALLSTGHQKLISYGQMTKTLKLTIYNSIFSLVHGICLYYYLHLSFFSMCYVFVVLHFVNVLYVEQIHMLSATHPWIEEVINYLQYIL